MHDRLTSRREIPAVSKVLDTIGDAHLPRPVVVAIIREHLAEMRKARSLPNESEIIRAIRDALKQHRAAQLQPVINATGVVLHTNFGRAPLSATTALFVAQIASNYNNLEFDLVSGQRGSRANYAERNLAILCEAEAATVVNNCAAALVLLVRHFAAPDREVIISRGELVQIGGGFRIGEILEDAGIKLREVGATNRTALSDYAKAIGPKTGMILKVHRSNFFMEGFVESAGTAALGELARKKRVPFVVDLGSGALDSTEKFAPEEREPTPIEELKNGADLVCFSGDKLFGGPQAGIIAGRKKFISALKREPLFRALRCDKLGLAALQATIDHHLNGDSASIPALGFLQASKDELRARAASIFERLRGLPAQISIGRGTGKVGGGTLPKSNVVSVTIDIVPQNSAVKDFADRLRNNTPPVIGYIASNRFRLDLRTVLPTQDDVLIDTIRGAFSA